ncbi:MAG TPA: hypothetical protein VG125_03625 [Pirellulales bacterium]|jgi:hypothetical protein|nr:hypothetical protein [Pirellulales bacterium]
MVKSQEEGPLRSDGSGGQAETCSVERHTLNPIKPPAAPAVILCEEMGAHVAQDRAIREKVRLYPLASVKEIVAMFELEGVKISPAAVKNAKRG